MTSPAAAGYPSPGTRAFWRQSPPERLAAFAALRRDAPVAFHEAGPGKRGFWSVTRYADPLA